MRRIGLLALVWVVLQFHGESLRAQTSIDILDHELDDAKQQHQDATSKQLSDLITALDQALQSSDQALQLYQNAGGDMPDPAPKIIANETETPDEEAAREAQDAAVKNALTLVIQLHCGIMRYGAYFIQQPDAKGLNDSWIAWLKQAAQIYAQTGTTPEDARAQPAPAADKQDNGQPIKPKKKSTGPDYVKALKDKAVRDSVISTYLGYTGWGDKPQGAWAVRDLPQFYRTQILDPLRTKPSPDTLAAWDAYIAMKSADEPDRDKWAQEEYPDLLFQRSCDDFYSSPSEEKLEVLVNLIKSNPTKPDIDGWIAQVKQMISDYRTYKSTGKMPPPPT